MNHEKTRSLDHQQDGAKDHARDRDEGDEQTERSSEGLRQVLGVGPAASQRTANQLTGPIAAITNTAATSARGDFSTQSLSRNQVGPRLEHPGGQHEHDHVAERDHAARTLLDVLRDEQLLMATATIPPPMARQ